MGPSKVTGVEAAEAAGMLAEAAGVGATTARRRGEGVLSTARKAVKSFCDLRVWQDAMWFAELALALCDGWDGADRELAWQLRRAAISIPSNIAEGHARKHTNHFRYHLSIALGSLAEADTQIEIAARRGRVPQHDLQPMNHLIQSIRRKLHALHAALPAA